MGGIDKASIEFGGVTLLERVVDAARDATKLIGVGPARPTSAPVHWSVEDPAGGGPVAAMAAGLAHVDAAVMVLLAVDMPFVTRAVVRGLVAACSEAEAVLVRDDGTPQPLLAAYRVDALRDRLAAIGPPTGRSMGEVVDGLSCSFVDEPGAARDVDTWDDLDALRKDG